MSHNPVVDAIMRRASRVTYNNPYEGKPLEHVVTRAHVYLTPCAFFPPIKAYGYKDEMRMFIFRTQVRACLNSMLSRKRRVLTGLFTFDRPLGDDEVIEVMKAEAYIPGNISHLLAFSSQVNVPELQVVLALGQTCPDTQFGGCVVGMTKTPDRWTMSNYLSANGVTRSTCAYLGVCG